MRVNVYQARCNDLATHIDSLSCIARDVGLDGRNLAAGDRHVADGIEANRRVDDAPALEDEIVGCGERARNAGEHCSARADQLASVHHGRYPYLRFGHTACLQRVDRTVP